ncbi:MAG: hypothetical protein WDO15_05935 [Bacteroidota bacterium]
MNDSLDSVPVAINPELTTGKVKSPSVTSVIRTATAASSMAGVAVASSFDSLFEHVNNTKARRAGIETESKNFFIWESFILMLLFFEELLQLSTDRRDEAIA